MQADRFRGVRSLTEEEAIRARCLVELRRKHGFTVQEGRRNRTHEWSKAVLRGEQKVRQVNGEGEEREADIDEILKPFGVTQEDVEQRAKELDFPFLPAHALVHEAIRQRFGFMGFDWKPAVGLHDGKPRNYVRFTNYPTVGGAQLSLLELLLVPLELVDGAQQHQAILHLVERLGHPADFDAQRERMESTGVGYKGLNGQGSCGMVSWLAGLEPFPLSTALERKLYDLASAIFLLYDAVGELFGQDSELTALLTHKVPSRIPQVMAPGRVDLIRPDIVIVQDPDGTLRPVITELESAPGGHGMTQAMQAGYGLAPQMVDEFIRYLEGRSYTVLATHEWPEYVFEQGAFCAELRRRGVDARILFDAPLAAIHEQVQGAWKVPAGAESWVREVWNTDFLGRLQELGFLEFISGVAPEDLPETLDSPESTVYFRFGYVDNWDPIVLRKLENWANQGATLVNPLWFCLENKALMAAIGLRAVREFIRNRCEQAITVLDRCVAKTWLLAPEFVKVSDVLGEDSSREACRQLLITKYGAWDGQNKSWGARSLAVGAQMSVETWRQHIEHELRLPHPVVVQHAINSARYHTAYVGRDGKVAVLYGARTRLTPFFLRNRAGETLCGGATVTLRANTFRVHGATDAVEAPVVFHD